MQLFVLVSSYMLIDTIGLGGGTLTIGNLFGGDDEPVSHDRSAPGSKSNIKQSQRFP
jgi:hypothetical protein